jgi:uncharacterized membrane protein YdjX (TVP38/TMEM64 family)
VSGAGPSPRASHRLALLRLAGLATFLLTAVVVVAASGSLSVDRVRDWADGYGAAGPLVFIALSAALTVGMFPGPLLAGASGLLFGTALGTPVSITAATLGATLACLLSRGVARDPVTQVGGPRILAIRDWVSRRGFTGVLLLRLMPGVPYTVVNYGVGLTHVPVSVFAAGTAIGCAPRAFAYTALGGQLGSFHSWEFIVALIVLVGMAALGLALAARDAELRAGVARLLPRRQ